MTERRRSTDQPESEQSRRVVVRVSAVAAVAVAAAFAAAGAALWLNADRTQQINDERAANILRSCREVNQRHDNTIRALDDLLERAHASPEQVKRSRVSTVLLIDALAPKRDCERLVAQQVGSSG